MSLFKMKKRLKAALRVRLKDVSLILFYVERLLPSSLGGEPLALTKRLLIRMKIDHQRLTAPSITGEI
ncbi:hypothetical protein M2263_003394 [Providencia alcalifaciens]|nr:hypothetical protein [Providencia alcalifaciens]